MKKGADVFILLSFLAIVQPEHSLVYIEPQQGLKEADKMLALQAYFQVNFDQSSCFLTIVPWLG